MTAAQAANPVPSAPTGRWLLMVLVVLAAVLTVLRPLPPRDWLALVDWPTVGALAGLLAITQGLERTGVLQHLAAAWLARVRDQRQLALGLCALSAALAAALTNDVSLFLLVPLARALAAQAQLPLARWVVLLALAVNAGSALTPIGNPQNLFLWQQSGLSFVAFMAMMAPAVALMLVLLALLVCALVPSRALPERQAASHPPLPWSRVALSAGLFVVFVVMLDLGLRWQGLALVALIYLVADRAVLRHLDLGLLLTIALMFVVLRQAAALPVLAAWLQQAPIATGWPAYVSAVLGSQLISNVPATILLAERVHDLRALAWGVNVGGFGLVIGSLANLIALRLARLPDGMRAFHRISLPFLLLTAVPLGWWIAH